MFVGDDDGGGGDVEDEDADVLHPIGNPALCLGKSEGSPGRQGYELGSEDGLRSGAKTLPEGLCHWARGCGTLLHLTMLSHLKNEDDVNSTHFTKFP